MTLQAWIKKPKNQKLLFLAIGVILLYLYLKNKEKAAANLGAYNPGYITPPSAGGRTDTGSTGGTPYNATSLPYTHTDKGYFTLTKNGNIYSDTYVLDSVVGGLRRLTTSGRTYTVFYWINEQPYANSDGTPKNFVGVTLPPGCFISIRKVYAESSWATTHQDIFDKGGEAWYLNGGSDPNRTFKTIMMEITT
jgi:hypothetical protein